MKSNTYELHNYADLNDMDDLAEEPKDSRKRKTSARGEKYSLRQKRQKRSATDEAEGLPDFHLELDHLVEPAGKSRKSTTTKSKTKAPPLSKYRRKTANARERTRMREINTAFETLRHCVPQAITGEDAANTNEKLTKITTLRLAMKYITMLSASMRDPSYESEFIGECLEESANRETFTASEEAEEVEVELPIPVPVKKPAKSKASGKKNATAGKRQSQKQGKMVPQIPAPPPISSGESCYATSSIGSPASSAYASLSSASSSNSHSSSSSPGLEVDSLVELQEMSALDSLLLDASDGDSLSCLSPGYGSLLTGSGESLLPGCRGDLPMSGLEKSDVELSLRLLDHRSMDSFDFASDQQPSSCIAAFSSLDSFSYNLLDGDLTDMFLA
nr:LOW QUALITY PROTEIN: helix-loop-helix protein delilah [Drosophila takahashii]